MRISRFELEVAPRAGVGVTEHMRGNLHFAALAAVIARCGHRGGAGNRLRQVGSVRQTALAQSDNRRVVVEHQVGAATRVAMAARRVTQDRPQHRALAEQPAAQSD